MAKNTNTEQDRNERESFDHINGITRERVNNFTEQITGAFAKAAEAAEMARKRKLAHEVGKCFFAAAAVAGLYLAESAGLISAVLTDPLRAIAYVYLGWHLCKIGSYRGRK
jgi:hypothetical protein